MRLQPLYDLQQEINRLFIAGSKFAKGDPRLQKHVPVLNKLGEKAPVFKKLASDIEELLVTDTQQSSEKLMAISTLLYSVLYTQGDMTEADVEEKEQVPHIPLEDINTAYSYLQLKPVMDALTTSNSGRLELLKDALERNLFDDSRTYPYLDFALADKYAELAYYVENTIIPKVGKAILPFLIKSFVQEDKTEQARRLRLLALFNYKELPTIIDEILSKTLPVLQAEVITILSGDPKNEELIIKLADDKNKLVRESAYTALAKLNTKASLEKLKDVYLKNKNKTNLPSIVTAIASSKLPFFFQEVFDEVCKSFEEFLALDKEAKDKELADKMERFCINLDVFENKDREEVYTYFEKILTDEQYMNLLTSKKGVLENLSYRVVHSMISTLNRFDLSKKIAFYEKVMDKVPATLWRIHLWSNYFYSAIEAGYSKEKIYNTFSDLFRRKILSPNHLYGAYSNDNSAYYYSYKEDEVKISAEKIDSRWTDILYDFFAGKMKWNYEYEHTLVLLHAMEPKTSKRFEKLILDLAGKLQTSELVVPFNLLMAREVDNRFELIYKIMEKFPKNTYYYALNRLKNIGFWGKFPKEYVTKYRELGEKTKLDAYNEIADEIESAYNK